MARAKANRCKPARHFARGGELMRMRILLGIAFVFGLLIGLAESKDILDQKNLEGLQKVNEVMTVEVRLSGDEPFDLEETKIKDILRKKLGEVKVQIDTANKANANLLIKIEGESMGGGGARIVTNLILFSRVASPFKRDNNIPAIIWSAENREEQVMSYDPEKKRLTKIKGKLNERVYGAIEAIMTKFQSDYKKANPK